MKECGKDEEIPTRVSSKISTVILKNVHETDNILSINETHESSCTENGKFCIRFGDGRRQMNLTVHSVTFEDQGSYALRYDHGFIGTDIFYIEVTGMCEPKLSSSTDKLTCEVDVENASITTIVWMDKHRKIYKIETDPENVTDTKLRATLKLTDETREVDICCTASYVKEGKKVEKQNCQIRPSHVGSGEVNDTDNKNIIILPILCVLVLAICVTLYLLRRRRMSFTQKSREDHQAENMEGAPLELHQRPQDQV